MSRQSDYTKRKIYQIRVCGHLDQRWADWFNGFDLTYLDEKTILVGSVADQAALHGVLSKIRDLGLFIELVQYEEKCESNK